MKKKGEFDNMVIADGNEDKGQILNIDISKCYQFKPENFEVDVTTIRYANNSFIQVMGQDVFVDFVLLKKTNLYTCKPDLIVHYIHARMAE